MTSPRGTLAELYGKVESVEGTAPSGNWARLPFVSFDLGGQVPLVADPTLGLALGRSQPAPYQGNLAVALTGELPIDLNNAGFWLNALFGAPTTTGTGPYVDVWKPAAAGTALPTISLEGKLHSTAATRYHLRTAIKANTLGIRWDGSTGRQTMSIGLIGRTAADSASSAAGTPTTAAYSCHLKQRWVFKIGGSAVADITGFDVSFSNGLDPYMTTRDQADGAAYAIDEGLIELTGSFTYRAAASTFYDDAEALTARELTLVNELSSGNDITFGMGTIYFERPSAPIQGPGAIQQTIPFRAAYDSSDAAMLVVTRNRTA